jgi:hypothetical protein
MRKITQATSPSAAPTPPTDALWAMTFVNFQKYLYTEKVGRRFGVTTSGLLTCRLQAL